MVLKKRSLFICQQCGHQAGKWHGRCPECASWNSLVETFTDRKTNISGSRASGKKPLKLSDVKSKKTSRISTKISELDRVLGGGLVLGQATLIAGEPGIGKSTILLQLAEKLGDFLYVSGEESVGQIKVRADRLKVGKKSIRVMEETDVDVIIDTISGINGKSLKGVVVDSIQTMSTSDLSGMAGSVGQVRECAFRLIRTAKQKEIPMLIVGHVTKEGSVAGPSVLMHLVDTVLWFEGDRNGVVRMLRAMKNRFGPTDEVGIFSMEEKGLVSLENPDKFFISETGKRVPGSVIASVMKGTRPFLVEIQSLVVPSKLAFSKRVSQGIDQKRLEMLLAVLIRRCGLPFYEYDCFVNVTGGINLKNDPSVDLAVCLSLASAYLDRPALTSLIAIGEVGLLGDIRKATEEDKRVKEAKRLGFKNIITSKNKGALRDIIRSSVK